MCYSVFIYSMRIELSTHSIADAGIGEYGQPHGCDTDTDRGS